MYMPFNCSKCQITFPTKKKYEAHCSTQKHISRLSEKNSFECNCGKIYTYKTNLTRHQRKCPFIDSQTSQNRHHVTTQNGKITTIFGNTVVHNETHVHNEIHNEITEHNIINPTFNFNFYLNEQCKDAVCIEDFCRSMIEQFNAIVNEGRLSMSFIDNQKTFEKMLGDLKSMESVQRPIQSYQGEIVERSRDDWKALTLDKLNQHVNGITNKVNWDLYSNCVDLSNIQDPLGRMQALKDATEVKSPLKEKDMETLEKTTMIGKIKLQTY